VQQAAESSPKRPRAHPKGRVCDPRSLQQLRELLGPMPRRRDLLLEYLHCLADAHGHLPAALLTALAEELGLAPVEVFEVASFYHHFDVVREGEAAPPDLTVRVCDSISCALHGAEALLAGLQEGLGREIRVQRVPCIGRCAEAPAAVARQRPVPRASVAAVQNTIAARSYRADTPAVEGYAEYRAGGGYRLLQRLAEQGPAARNAALAELERADLRGMGGAGFPVARKQRAVLAHAAPRLLVVNIDEGEPGTFKDRYLLEQCPHRCLEGMLIAAWMVEAEAVYIYLRDEYAGCRAMLAAELKQLRAAPPCSLPVIELRRGAGAYVCGEESALRRRARAVQAADPGAQPGNSVLNHRGSGPRRRLVSGSRPTRVPRPALLLGERPGRPAGSLSGAGRD
jgi:NADH:ubiquinone oxidoreductase subunit E